MLDRCDTLVVGAGLAGALAAWELRRAGVRDLVVVDAGSDRRASDAPGAMAHCFAGRSLRLKPHLLEVFGACGQTLEAWRALAPQAVRPMPMIRLVLGTYDGQQLVDSWSKQRDSLQQAGIQIEHLDAGAVAARFPWLGACQSAFVYGPAWSVSMGELLEAVRGELAERGVRFVRAQVSCLRRQAEAWRWEDRLEARRVVLAPGAGIEAWFPHLQGMGVGGELVILDEVEGLSPQSMVSGGGAYLTPGPGARLVCGATRWPGEGWAGRQDGEAVQVLQEKAGRLLAAPPQLASGRVWRGLRWVFQGDRHPLVGEVPGAPGLWLLGALGSKGLLWGPWCARQLVGAMERGAPVPARVGLGRAGKDEARWRSPALLGAG